MMTKMSPHAPTPRVSAPGPGADPLDPNVRPAMSTGARMLLVPIIAYRRWISPALPARCRFYPSCSAYAVESISTHGVIRGIGLATWRLLRCQPFNRGGYDPVPPRRPTEDGVR
jgi:putative membrane protein insertion efficiency factor